MAYRHHHHHRPEGYGATYYKEEREVIRDPYDSYTSEYMVQEYANPGHHHHHHIGGYTDRVTEVVTYESNPVHHHHHHGGVAGIVEKIGDIIYEKTHDPYKRKY